MSKKQFVFFVGILLSPFWLPQLMAQTPTVPQEDSLATKELAPVRIVASRLPATDRSTPLAVSVLDRRFLQQGQQQLSIQESLDAVPGVFSLNAENFSQDVRIAIRGFGARAAFGIRGIKLLVDGIPESTPDGQAQVDNLDMGLMEQMEVVRGPSSGLYGNAAGGVIRLRTQRPTEDFLAEGRITLGSYGLQRYQLKTGQRLGKFDYMVYNAYTQTNGYRVQSGMKSNLFNTRLGFRPDSSLEISLLLNHVYSPQADDPGGLTLDEVMEDRQQARDRNLQFETGETVEQGRAALKVRKQVGEAHEFQLRTYYLYRDFANALPFENGGIVNLDRTYWGGGLSYRFQGSLGSMPYLLRAGVDVDRQSDDRRRYNNLEGEQGALSLDQQENFYSTGLFLVQRLEVTQALSVNLATRFDALQLEAEDAFLADGDDSGQLDFQQVNPSLGISYALNPQDVLYANLSTSFETPALTELSANPTGDGGFNASLQPQQATNYEVGFKGLVGQRLKLDVAVFAIQLRNELVPYELADFPGRTFFRNAGESRRLGAELAGTLYLNPQWRAMLSYTYGHFTYQDYELEGVQLSGNFLPALPQHTAFAGLLYQHASGLYGRLTARWVGEMFADDGNQTPIDPFTVINLRLGYEKAFQGWSLAPFVGVNNLLDADYFNNVRINAFGGRFYEPAMGLNIFGGVRVRIGKAP